MTLSLAKEQRKIKVTEVAFCPGKAQYIGASGGTLLHKFPNLQIIYHCFCNPANLQISGFEKIKLKVLPMFKYILSTYFALQENMKTNYSKFIIVCHNTDFIVALTQRVISQFCRFAGLWKHRRIVRKKLKENSVL